MAELTKAQRAWAFYNNDIYDDEYLDEYNLFDDTREIFNPVPKTAFIMNALTMQQEINIELKDDQDEKQEDDNENPALDALKNVWEFNDFQNMKYVLALWLILSQKGVIELVKKDDNIIFVIHDPDLVETEYQNGRMVYCKIQGTTKQFNRDDKEFETVSITKEYFNVDGYRRLIETIDDEETESSEDGEEGIPLAYQFIPVVEFDTDYDLGPLFNKTDYYNLLEAYLENIFYLHGDPLIWDNLQGGMSDQGKEKTKEGRYKEQTILHLNNPDAQMSYLEMQGNVAELMLDKQEEIKDNIANDYPEYVLATLLSKGDPSGDALKIKSIEIEAKANSLRGDLESGIVDMNNKALRMLGRSEVSHGINFGGILPDSVQQLLELVKGLREIRFISKQTGMEKFPDLIEDVDKEIKRLNDEDQQMRNEINRELSDNAHTQN